MLLCTGEVASSKGTSYEAASRVTLSVEVALHGWCSRELKLCPATKQAAMSIVDDFEAELVSAIVSYSFFLR